MIRNYRFDLFSVLLAASLAALPDFTSAQVGIGRGEPGRPVAVGGVQRIQFGRPLAEGSMLESKASLKTDPELESILEKADRFRQERQYDIAVKLWQSVLERSGDALYSEDDEVFYSLSRKVEQILAGLPAEDGLSTYRITADAGAKEILAAASGPFDVRALRQVVKEYFISSLGDEAALTLSSIYMDDYDFVGAIRMLRKISELHPDPSVSLVEVYARRAICQAMMGEAEEAAESLTRAMSMPADARSVNLQDIGPLIESDARFDHGVSSPNSCSMLLANRKRDGVQPQLPSGILASDLTAIWQYHFAADATRWADLKQVKPIFGPDTAARVADSVLAKETQMIEKWRQRNWRPAGSLLWDQGRVYFKTVFDLTVWDRSADGDRVVWRPLWRNEFKMDDYSSAMFDLQRTFNRRRGLPGNQLGYDYPYEIQLFADRVSSQMSIQDGVLYTVEGARFDSVPAPESNPHRLRYQMPNRRSRSNRLTAYEADTGRLLWTLPPLEVDEKEQPIVADGEFEPERIRSGGFMGAPIHYAGLALVALNHGGAISVYALDPKQQGKTIWSSFLCDESSLGANPHAPVNLSIDGSDLLATCGLGVVFVLDPTTGLIRMARRYQREPVVESMVDNFRPQRMSFESWSSDTILAFGRQMICFSSDANSIESFDRNSGSLIWRADAEPLGEKVDYLLGLYDGILYAAGRRTVLAFHLREEGRMIWGGGPLFDGKTSYGRGMLTPAGIFIPVEDEIYHFSLAGKEGKAELFGKTSVELGTGAPVGNLYSDGRKIWVLGANRLYALGPKPPATGRSPTSADDVAEGDVHDGN